MDNNRSNKCMTTDEIYDIIDGEVAEEICTEFYEHIKTCEKCKQEYESIKSLKTILRDYTSEPSSDFTTQTLARLKTVERNPFIRFASNKSFKIIASTAACIILAFVVITGGLLNNDVLLQEDLANNKNNEFDIALYSNDTDSVYTDGKNDSIETKNVEEVISPDKEEEAPSDHVTAVDSAAPGNSVQNPSASDAGGRDINGNYWDEIENPTATDSAGYEWYDPTPVAPMDPVAPAPMPAPAPEAVNPEFTDENKSHATTDTGNPVEPKPVEPQMPSTFPAPSIIETFYRPTALSSDYQMNQMGQNNYFTYAIYNNMTYEVILVWSDELSSIEEFEELGFSTAQEYTNYSDTEVYYSDYNGYRYIYWKQDCKFFVLRLVMNLTIDNTGLEFTEIEEYHY